MEAIKYKNQKKLEELLVQDPDIHPHYKFETTKSKSQLKKTFGIFSFLEKVGNLQHNGHRKNHKS